MTQSCGGPDGEELPIRHIFLSATMHWLHHAAAFTFLLKKIFQVQYHTSDISSESEGYRWKRFAIFLAFIYLSIFRNMRHYASNTVHTQHYLFEMYDTEVQLVLAWGLRSRRIEFDSRSPNPIWLTSFSLGGGVCYVRRRTWWVPCIATTQLDLTPVKM